MKIKTPHAQASCNENVETWRKTP